MPAGKEQRHGERRAVRGLDRGAPARALRRAHRREGLRQPLGGAPRPDQGVARRGAVGGGRRRGRGYGHAGLRPPRQRPRREAHRAPAQSPPRRSSRRSTCTSTPITASRSSCCAAPRADSSASPTDCIGTKGVKHGKFVATTTGDARLTEARPVSSVATGLSTLDRLDRLARQDTAVHRVDPRAKVARHGRVRRLRRVVRPLRRARPAAVRRLSRRARRRGRRAVRLPRPPAARRVAVRPPRGRLQPAARPRARDPRRRASRSPAAGSRTPPSCCASCSPRRRRSCSRRPPASPASASPSRSCACPTCWSRSSCSSTATSSSSVTRRCAWRGRARCAASGAAAPGARVYAQMLGQLLLRTFARAQRVYLAMKCRGFDGQVRVARRLRVRTADVAFVLGWSALFVRLPVRRRQHAARPPRHGGGVGRWLAEECADEVQEPPRS